MFCVKNNFLPDQSYPAASPKHGGQSFSTLLISIRPGEIRNGNAAGGGILLEFIAWQGGGRGYTAGILGKIGGGFSA